MPARNDLPVFSAVMELTSLLLDTVGRFPRNLRPTLGQRLLERGLDAAEGVVSLRYTKDREALFASTNLSLEHIRVLTRLAFERRLLSAKQYERLATVVDSVGRQLGAWRRKRKDGVPGDAIS